MKRIVGRHRVNVVIIVFLSIIVCALPLTGKKVMASALHEFDLALFYRVRFEILGQSPKGQHYISLFDAHTREITQIIIDRPSIAVESLSVLMAWQPNLDALVNGHGDKAIITDEQVQAVSAYLDHLSRWASPELKSVIATERLMPPLAKTPGMSMNQAWVYLNLDARFPRTPDASNKVPVFPPEQISAHLENWTLPLNPLYSIIYDPNVWEFSSWDNGVGPSWEFTNHSLPDCVVTQPVSLSDPYSRFDIVSKPLGEYQYESRTPIYPGFTFYVVYKPLDIPAIAPSSNPEQKELFFIVYPEYENTASCIAQGEALLGNIHLSSDDY